MAATPAVAAAVAGVAEVVVAVNPAAAGGAAAAAGGGGGGGVVDAHGVPTAPSLCGGVFGTEVGAVLNPAALLATDTLAKHREGDDLELGLRWDFFEGMDKVDLDAQAVVFDSTGKVLDACYYNNMSALGGALTHSGDNKDGVGEGDDELIRMDIDRFPPAARVVMIVVSAYNGGSFINVESAFAQLRDHRPDGSVPIVDVAVGAHGEFTSLIMAALFYHEPNQRWYVRELQQPAMGRHFQDCMDVIRGVVDTFLDPGMICERELSVETTFQMQKNDAAMLPRQIRRLMLGLGWETPGSDLDLDASCLMLDGQCPPNVRHTVYFGKLTAPGVTHLGDNLTGVGKGDDEQIKVDLAQVPADVHQLVFTVNIYSDGRSFSEVFDSYVRLVVDDSTHHELATYALDARLGTRGFVFCKLCRAHCGWEMVALGHGCDGRRGTDVDTVDVVRGIRDPVNTPAAPGARGAPRTPHNGQADECCTIS